MRRYSLGRTRAFTPATAQRYARWHTKPKSNTEFFPSDDWVHYTTIVRHDHLDHEVGPCNLVVDEHLLNMPKDVSMLQMDIAKWLVHDLSVKHLISMAKDLSQFCRFSHQWIGRKGYTSDVHDVLWQGWSTGTLNDLCYFYATTG